MRIAIITSEFSGLPRSGGIGTYFLELAVCLAKSGQEVEVFTSGMAGDVPPLDGITFHHLGSPHPPEFSVMAAKSLKKRHVEDPFDLIECAESKAEGCFAAKAVPEAAFVIRMHSPAILLERYLDLPMSRLDRFKNIFWQVAVAMGAVRRGLPVQPILIEPYKSHWVPSRDIEERNCAAAADLVIVMNRAMRDFAKFHWWIKEDAIVELPNPLRMNSPVEKHSQERGTHPPTIGFLGRLEPRKGIIEFARALEEVLADFPKWRVEIAGRSEPSCISGSDAGEIAKSRLNPFADRVEFIGPVAAEQVPLWFSRMDLCVFPSHWETFSYVALEAAAAGKAIIATDTGAIPHILDHGRAGEITPPGNVKVLARSLRRLMGNPELRKRLGSNARVHALEHFHHDRVTKKILDAYRVALDRRDQRVARMVSDQ